MTNKLLKLANIIAFGFFAIVTVIFFFMPSKMYTQSYQIIGIVCALLFSGLLAILFHTKIADKIKSTTPKKLYTICALAMLFIQLLIVAFSNYAPVTDAKHLSDICINFLNGNENLYQGMLPNHYFYLERYSNNWLLFLTETLLYKISHVIYGDYSYAPMTILTTLFIQLSYYFLYKTSTLILDASKSKIAILIMAFCPYFYAFAPIFYTDTVSLPFVIMSVYFAVKSAKEDFGKRCVLHLCLCGIFTSIGYFLKGNVAVVGVAVLIFLVLKSKPKQALIFLIALAVSFVTISKSVETAMYSLDVISEERIEEYKFPMTHWLMMGLNGKGGYNNDDFFFTYNISGYDEKNHADVEVIKERVHDYKIGGLLKHFAVKIRYTWQQVNYQSSWQYQSTDNLIGRFFQSSVLYFSWCFIFQNMLVILLLCSFYKGVKNPTDEKFIVRISSFGLMLFLLLWETRSRYMLNFLPLYFLMMSDGIDVYVGFFKTLKAKFLKKFKPKTQN